ncbi:MAG TPA: hypothetical protein VMA77_20405 [Solirubrobacteraceae bacterium]|nr:hypothetical protein [Solirubrobacteraceae bacterium]
MSGALEYLVILAVLSAAVVFVTWPLRIAAVGRRPGERSELDERSSLDELEAAREAKYRELRDAELDHLTGKLSDDDYEALDHSLRGEAIEILHGLDRELAREREDDSATIDPA